MDSGTNIQDQTKLKYFPSQARITQSSSTKNDMQIVAIYQIAAYKQHRTRLCRTETLDLYNSLPIWVQTSFELRRELKMCSNVIYILHSLMCTRMSDLLHISLFMFRVDCWLAQLNERRKLCKSKPKKGYQATSKYCSKSQLWSELHISIYHRYF